MKPGLFLSVFIIIGIIVAASFGLSILPTEPIYNLPDSVAANALYVCPATSESFDQIAKILTPIQGKITIVFFFVLMLVFAMYAWGLYKNLLDDKFAPKEYQGAWNLLKALCWATVILTILIHTPNSFRTVKIAGVDGKFILCEDNTPGAKPVRSTAVITHTKIAP